MTDKVGRIEFGPAVSRSELFRLHAQGVKLVPAKSVDELRAEIARLRQGLWDVYAILGFDTDGDKTPESLASDIVKLVVDAAREHVAELEERKMDSWGDAFDRDRD